MTTTKPGHNQKIGKWGEQIAAEYLKKKGYALLATNIRTPHGEIDIIARLEDITIFVEVKTRTNKAFGLPEEGLTYRKLAHMRACASHYCAENKIDTWQCDAISVEGKPGQIPHIEHFENVAND